MQVSGIGSTRELWATAGVGQVGRTGGTDGVSTTRPSAPPPPSGAAGGSVPPHIDAAAKALGLSADEVVEALSDGASLADLAEEQGVSHDDLVSALVAAAPDELQGMDGLTEMTEQLVDQQGLGRPMGPPPSGSSGVFGASMTGAQQDTLSAVAQVLGTGTDTLLSALSNGTSLADLFDRAGVTTHDLAGLLQQSLLLETDA